jgi:ribonuclease BN (tRNA processing enzyme)
MAELLILGSGAGFATADRFSTSIALLVDRAVYIFDCGEPCSALLFRQGVDPLAVKAIFVSHMHPDHVGGLAPLLFSMHLPGRYAGDDTSTRFREWSVRPTATWYRNSITFPADETTDAEGTAHKPEVSLFVPREAVEPMKTYLPSVYLAPSILAFSLEICAIKPGMIYQDGTIAVEAISNSHLSAHPEYARLPAEYPHMALESYSFAVTVDGRKIVYSGDITSLRELEPLLAGADTVIIEMAHFAPEDVEEFVNTLPTALIVHSHVHPGLEDRVQELVARLADPRIVLAHDGLRLPV